MSDDVARQIPEMMIAVHHLLRDSKVDHAFGGALALAWCTQQARGTIDIDVNAFVSPEQAWRVLDALPSGVTTTDSDRELLERDGQARLWWGRTPIDVFLDTTEFHRDVAARVRWEPFEGEDLPFLSCRDLAVFKAFFDRTKDWADLEAMAEAGSLAVGPVADELAQRLGGDDHRIARLLSISTTGHS